MEKIKILYNTRTILRRLERPIKLNNARFSFVSKNLKWILVCVVLFCVLCTGLFLSRTKETSTDQSKQNRILALFYQDKERFFKESDDLTVEKIVKMSATKEIIFVDVRNKKEQDVSMIASAIAHQEFDPNKTAYRDKTVVCYCTIGSRSGKYCQDLKGQGFEAYNMIGGILLWVYDGQELVDNNGATKRAHVYGKRWNLLPDHYQSVY